MPQANPQKRNLSSGSNVVILGRGRVGGLVERQLNAIGDLKVTSYDITDGLDLMGDPGVIERILKDKVTTLICCLPVSVMKYHLRPINDPEYLAATAQFDVVKDPRPRSIAYQCALHGVNYLDLTEDVDLMTDALGLSDLAVKNNCTIIPGCGLAPGLINYLGAELADRFNECEKLDLAVGALPRNTITRLGYALTWSPEGLLNEYLNDCDVLRGGHIFREPALTDMIRTQVDGVELEGFLTSGGIGTLHFDLQKKVKNMTYRSLRYPGHCDLVKFLLDELNLKADPETMFKLLYSLPHTDEDVVYVQAVAEGWLNGRRQQIGWKKAFTAGNKSALQLLTAVGISSVAELLMIHYALPRGVLTHSKIPLRFLINTNVFAQNPIFSSVKEVFGLT